MKKIVYVTVILLTIAGGYFISCQKEEKPSDKETGFTFSVNTTALKSASITLGDARKIVLTITNADGTPTRYASYKVDIFNMNGLFFSDNLFLKTGSYKLTLFTLIDSAGNTIYAAPISGSPEAAYISNPLPVSFTIQANVVNSVNVHVLSTYGKTPDDFGLVQFPFTGYFQIMVGVFSLDSNKFSTANFLVGAPNNIINREILSPISNNIITISDSFSIYTLRVEKNDFVYQQTFTNDSLKSHNPSHGNMPLRIDIPRKCPGLEQVYDNEGNAYPVTRIGNQIWMAKDLLTKHYNNGDSIPELTSPFDYPDSIPNCRIGNYYSWLAITDARGVCPMGMHIPSIGEWRTLIDYVGGIRIAGSRLEYGGTEWGWDYYKVPQPTNPYCFSALSSSMVERNTWPAERYWETFFWSSTSSGPKTAILVGLFASGDGITNSAPIDNCTTIRCVKNAQ